MKSIFRKAICITVILFLFITTLSFNVFASEENNVTQEEATQLAIIHIAENIGYTNWDEATYIKETTPMYSKEGNLNAYHFELSNGATNLSNGYIIIAATNRINYIQEFSDEALSSDLFKEKLDNDEKIIYCSPLQYFKEKDNTFYDENDNIVKSKKVKNMFKESTTYEENNKELTKTLEIIDDDNLDVGNWTTKRDGQYKGGNYAGIHSTYKYIRDRYGKSYSFEKSKYLKVKSNYNIPSTNGCSLAAVTTILKYHQTQGYTKIPSSWNTIHKAVKKIATDKGWYSKKNGTSPTKIDNLVTAAFKKYSYKNGRGNNDYALKWSVAKKEIDSKRPFIFNMANDYYSDHSVVVYGYKIYKKKNSSKRIRFLCVADGWSSTPNKMFIDWNQFVGFGSWTKVFPK